MSQTYYCAILPDGAEMAPLDLPQVFPFANANPTRWDNRLGQEVPNPTYVENAYLDLASSWSDYLREELGLEGSDIDGEGLAWPLGDVKTRITKWRKTAIPEMGEESDPYIDRLEALVDLGMRHGGTHLVML